MEKAKKYTNNNIIELYNRLKPYKTLPKKKKKNPNKGVSCINNLDGHQCFSNSEESGISKIVK